MTETTGPFEDEFDAYLAEQLKDPGFRRAFERAEWVSARWYRRFLNRHEPWLLRRAGSPS